MKAKKKRNPSDLTGRNSKHLKKRLEFLERVVRELAKNDLSTQNIIKELKKVFDNVRFRETR